MRLPAFQSPQWWKGTGGAGAAGGLRHSSSCRFPVQPTRSDLHLQPSHPIWHHTIPPKSPPEAEFKQKKKVKLWQIVVAISNAALLISCSDPQGRAGPSCCRFSVSCLQICPSQFGGATAGAALSPSVPPCVMLLEVRRKVE